MTAEEEIEAYYQQCADEHKAHEYRKTMVGLSRYYDSAKILEEFFAGALREAAGLDEEAWRGMHEIYKAAKRIRGLMEWEFNFAKKRIAELHPALANQLPANI